IEGEQVLDRLASHDQSGLPVADRDDRGSGGVVVLAGQAPTVCAGPGDGDEVTGPQVGGEVLVQDDDVATLAVSADHPGEHRRGVASAACEGAGVVRLVEGRTDVVAHATVHGHIGARHPVADGDRL